MGIVNNSLSGCLIFRIGILALFAGNGVSSDCDFITRQASGRKGHALDTWVNHGPLESEEPAGKYNRVALAELTFFFSRGQQGIRVLVCNQQRKLTAIEIDDVGPDVHRVPSGCAIQIRCDARDGVSGGCEADYRFRWIH